MNSWVIAFYALLATVNASVIPTTKILEGPSSRAILAGPDGSLITSESAGGRIALEEPALPIIPADLHLRTHTLAYPSQTLLVKGSPELFVSTPQFLNSEHILTAYPTQVLVKGQTSENTLITGPSGTISVTKNLDNYPYISGHGLLRI